MSNKIPVFVAAMVRSSTAEIVVHSLNEGCLNEDLGILTVFPVTSAAAVKMLLSVLAPNLVFLRSPDLPVASSLEVITALCPRAVCEIDGEMRRGRDDVQEEEAEEERCTGVSADDRRGEVEVWFEEA